MIGVSARSVACAVSSGGSVFMIARIAAQASSRSGTPTARPAKNPSKPRTALTGAAWLAIRAASGDFPKDRRVWRLQLTPAATPILREIKKYRAELHELMTAGLDPATLRVMAEGLLRMKANLAAELRESDAVRASGARNG